MPKRVDDNQAEIVQALRQVGCSVQHLHEVGRGCPDILVGFRGINYLFEIKDGNKIPSRQKLTPDEEKWHQLWNGRVLIIKSTDNAFKAIGLF